MPFLITTIIILVTTIIIILILTPRPSPCVLHSPDRLGSDPDAGKELPVQHGQQRLLPPILCGCEMPSDRRQIQGEGGGAEVEDPVVSDLPGWCGESVCEGERLSSS
jgi:hypothetical protein